MRAIRSERPGSGKSARHLWHDGNTAFYGSRLDLRLAATHPDRTGGLGCVTDVQTSFWLLLLGTGVLFAAFVYFKVRIEGTVDPATLWVPVIGYFALAPSVFQSSYSRCAGTSLSRRF